MNTDKHLDEQIKQALEKFQAKYDGQAWEAFEQRLDQDDANANPSGANTPFDDVISGKLNRLEVPLATSDWSMMEKMIEADETAELLEDEAGVDNLVYEKLEKFEVPFQPHHWQMMAHRLEEEFFFRYHLLRCKAAEAALMLLLLLTIVHYTPVLNNHPDGNFDQPTQPQQPSAVPLEKTGSPKLKSPAATQPNVPIAASTPASTKHKIVAPKLKAKNIPPVETISPATTSDAYDFSGNSSIVEALPSLPLSPVSALDAPATLFESMTEQRFLKNTLTTSGMSDDALGKTALLASLDTQPVQSKYAWEVPQLPQRVFEKQHQLRFNIFTSTDFAYVLTPPNKYSVFDTLIATDQDTTMASGYGGGITVSWKKDKWEFQTGGIYSFKRYIPNTPVFLFETVNYYIREEFNGVQLDILQVPLNVAYHFKNEGKWRMYSNIGVSGHFITSSVYEIKTNRTPSFSNFAMLPTPAGLPDDNKSIREEKEFPDGLIDGGSIHDNFYATANLGLGIERFVSPRWSVFFQPNYQHHLLTDGIGVNGEKLYNLSFYLGTKVSLK